MKQAMIRDAAGEALFIWSGTSQDAPLETSWSAPLIWSEVRG
jgi:hypothetical protein